MRSSRAWTTLLLVGAFACHKAEEGDGPAPTPVKVIRVKRTTVMKTLNTGGPLVPPPGADVKLGALLAGRLSEVTVAEGDKVKSGQVLAKIEATPFRDVKAQAEALVAQAKAQHVNDVRKLDRAKKLFEAGIAARQEVDDAEAQATSSDSALRTAVAGLSTAQNQLGRTELRAPFDGVVAHVFVASGEPVDGSGKPVLEVAHTEVLEVHAVLSAAQATLLHVGQKAELWLNGLDRRWEGEVVALSPLLDAQTGTATARIRLQNADGFLKGGEVAQVRIVIATHADVLAVPPVAIVPGEAPQGGAGGASEPRSAVEVVDGQNHALHRQVTLGARGEGWVEVTDGLKEGETVIVQGAYALPEGAPVRVEGAGS